MSRISSETVIFVLAAMSAVAAMAGNAHYNKERRLANQVAPEFIQTQGLLPPAEYVESSGGKFPETRTYWVTAETDDWVFFNGPRGTEVCEAVLEDFGDVNARSETYSLAAMRILSSGFKDKPIEIRALVPRFKSAPAGLDRCPGFRYDPESHLLLVGAKKLAYLAPNQPRLGAAAN